MRINILHNFISPVTGRILATTDYVLVGDGQGIATPSPALIDLRLDLINLRKDHELARNADFVIGFPNIQLPNAQVLSKLANGVMINTAGIVSTTDPVDLGFAPADATYIIQTPNSQLPNAQVLEVLGPGITKLVNNGVFAIAIPDVDYVATTNSLQHLVDVAAHSETVASLAKTNAEQSKDTATNEASSANSSLNSVNASLALVGLAVVNANISLEHATESAAAAVTSANNAHTAATNATNYLNNVLTNGITELPVTGDLDMHGYRIKNLHQSPEEDFDAISMTFLWDLMHNRVDITE